MEVKTLAMLNEKVGENNHYYYCAPNADLNEAEFALKRFLAFVQGRIAEEKAKAESKTAPVEEIKPEEPKVD